jgi:hypothetical protein
LVVSEREAEEVGEAGGGTWRRCGEVMEAKVSMSERIGMSRKGGKREGIAVGSATPPPHLLHHTAHATQQESTVRGGPCCREYLRKA